MKYNISNGGPAPEHITEAIWEASKRLTEYYTLDTPDIDIDRIGNSTLGAMIIEICDSTAEYITLMENIFDFDQIAALLRGPFTMRYDALHAVTGPYAHALFEKHLGAPSGSVVNDTPLVDFGGGHPDPNLVYAKSLVDCMYRTDAPDFGAASDGDGDRHMILGRSFFVSPSDSLSMLVAYADHIPTYRNRVKGVARSMPTARAVDAVAAQRQISLYETPTGWKYFGDLMDADRVTFCGEESFGAGSTHIREKDGLWAILFWLSIVAGTGRSVAELVKDHWREFGRHYYTRHDYESLPLDQANMVMQQVSEKLASLKGQQVGGVPIQLADEFSYVDPIDHSLTEHQGVRIMLDDASRIILRLSGTGTAGSTLRLYFEKPVHNVAQQNHDVQEMLRPLICYADDLTQIGVISKRSAPDVIT